MKYLIKHAQIINENKIEYKDIIIKDGIIQKIDTDISDINSILIDASNQFVIPGIIDDQVLV